MNNSWIYIIGSEDKPYKIGLSKNPNKRLKSLQTGHPKLLKIHYTEEIPECKVRYIESCIHDALKLCKTHGEWFDISLENAKLEVKFAVIRYLD